MGLLISVSSWSCDICNDFTGINPGDLKQSIGLTFRSRNLYGKFNEETQSYTSRHSSHLNSTYETEEQYQVYDTRFRYYLNNKNLFQVSLPVVRNSRIENDSTTCRVTGLADFSILFFYQLYEKETKKGNQTRIQRFWGGAGLKLPSGMRKLRYQSQFVDLDMQGSSGSLDFLIASNYQAKIGKTGINQINTFKLNTSGSENYQYGNSLNSNLLVFYQIPLKKIVTFTPTSGLFLETAGNDRQNREMVAKTRNTVLFYSLGMNIFTERLNLEMHWQPVVYRSKESQQLPVVNRWVIGLQIFL